MNNYLVAGAVELVAVGFFLKNGSATVTTRLRNARTPTPMMAVVKILLSCGNEGTPTFRSAFTLKISHTK